MSCRDTLRIRDHLDICYAKALRRRRGRLQTISSFVKHPRKYAMDRVRICLQCDVEGVDAVVPHPSGNECASPYVLRNAMRLKAVLHLKQMFEPAQKIVRVEELSELAL